MSAPVTATGGRDAAPPGHRRVAIETITAATVNILAAIFAPHHAATGAVPAHSQFSSQSTSAIAPVYSSLFWSYSPSIVLMSERAMWMEDGGKTRYSLNPFGFVEKRADPDGFSTLVLQDELYCEIVAWDARRAHETDPCPWAAPSGILVVEHHKLATLVKPLPRRVLLMAELGSSGLWWDEPSGLWAHSGMADPMDLGLSEEIRAKLALWIDWYEDMYTRSAARDPFRVLSPGATAHTRADNLELTLFDQMGRSIAHALQGELGPVWEIRHWNEAVPHVEL